MRSRTLSLLLTLTLLLVTLVPLFATGQSEVPPLGSEKNPIIWSFVPSGEMQRVAAGARRWRTCCTPRPACTSNQRRHRVRRRHRGAVGQPAQGAHVLARHLRLHHGRRPQGRAAGRPGLGAQRPALLQRADHRRGRQGHQEARRPEGQDLRPRRPAVHQRLDHPDAHHRGRRHRPGTGLEGRGRGQPRRGGGRRVQRRGGRRGLLRRRAHPHREGQARRHGEGRGRAGLRQDPQRRRAVLTPRCPRRSGTRSSTPCWTSSRPTRARRRSTPPTSGPACRRRRQLLRSLPPGAAGRRHERRRSCSRSRSAIRGCHRRGDGLPIPPFFGGAPHAGHPRPDQDLRRRDRGAAGRELRRPRRASSWSSSASAARASPPCCAASTA